MAAGPSPAPPTSRQGVHTLRVDGLDAEGKVVNRVEVPFFREDQTKVVAAAAAPPEQPCDRRRPSPLQPRRTPAAAAREPTAQPQPPTRSETRREQQAAAAARRRRSRQPPAPAAPKEGRIVIQPGNNLWRISRVLYGTGNKFTMLYEANKDQIRNPNRIYPGQIFKTPDVAPKVETDRSQAARSPEA